MHTFPAICIDDVFSETDWSSKTCPWRGVFTEKQIKNKTSVIYIKNFCRYITVYVRFASLFIRLVLRFQTPRTVLKFKVRRVGSARLGEIKVNSVYF